MSLFLSLYYMYSVNYKYIQQDTCIICISSWFSFCKRHHRNNDVSKLSVSFFMHTKHTNTIHIYFSCVLRFPFFSNDNKQKEEEKCGKHEHHNLC